MRQVIAFALHSTEDSVDSASSRYYPTPGEGLLVTKSDEHRGVLQLSNSKKSEQRVSLQPNSNLVDILHSKSRPGSAPILILHPYYDHNYALTKKQPKMGPWKPFLS